jgi:PAS domain-containing protein
MTLFGRRRVVVEVIAVGVVYYAAARLALLMQLPGTNADAIWPPSGIGLGAMLLWGTRVWPGVAAAAFLAALSTVPATPAGLVASTLIAGANALELIVACAIIRRVSGSDNPFERAGYALGFVSATVVAAFIHATVDVTSFNLTGVIDSSMNRATWLTSLVGDAAGMIVLAPAIYAWGRTRAPPVVVSASMRTARDDGRDPAARRDGIRQVGQRAYGADAAVSASVVVGGLQVRAARDLDAGADRLRPGRVAHVDGHEDPGEHDCRQCHRRSFARIVRGAAGLAPRDSVFHLHDGCPRADRFAAIAERDQSRRDLGESERRFRTIFEQAAVGVALVDASTGRFLRVNQRYGDILGYTPEQMLGITFREITIPTTSMVTSHSCSV